MIALALVAMVASAQAQTLRRHAKADQQALEALEKSHAADVQDSLEQVRFAAAKAPVETDKMGADDIAPAEPAKPNATISLSKNDTRGENSTIPSNDDTKAAVDDLMKVGTQETMMICEARAACYFPSPWLLLLPSVCAALSHLHSPLSERLYCDERTWSSV